MSLVMEIESSNQAAHPVSKPLVLGWAERSSTEAVRGVLVAVFDMPWITWRLA